MYKEVESAGDAENHLNLGVTNDYLHANTQHITRHKKLEKGA